MGSGSSRRKVTTVNRSIQVSPVPKTQPEPPLPIPPEPDSLPTPPPVVKFDNDSDIERYSSIWGPDTKVSCLFISNKN
jgi:hypothetical protein